MGELLGMDVGAPAEPSIWLARSITSSWVDRGSVVPAMIALFAEVKHFIGLAASGLVARFSGVPSVILRRRRQVPLEDEMARKAVTRCQLAAAVAMSLPGRLRRPRGMTYADADTRRQSRRQQRTRPRSGAAAGNSVAKAFSARATKVADEPRGSAERRTADVVMIPLDVTSEESVSHASDERDDTRNGLDVSSTTLGRWKGRRAD